MEVKEAVGSPTSPTGGTTYSFQYDHLNHLSRRYGKDRAYGTIVRISTFVGQTLTPARGQTHAVEAEEHELR
jgi:hypothetical protein